MARLRTDLRSNLKLPPGFLAVMAIVSPPGYTQELEWVPVRASSIVAYPYSDSPGVILLYLKDVDEPFLIRGDKDELSQQIADAADALTPDDGTL